MTSGTQIFLGPARNKSEFLQFEWGSVNPLGIRSLWMPLLPPPPGPCVGCKSNTTATAIPGNFYLIIFLSFCRHFWVREGGGDQPQCVFFVCVCVLTAANLNPTNIIKCIPYQHF